MEQPENTRLLKLSKKEAKIGATLGGPILFPYVFWVIREAREQNMKNLYFVARDGYILKKIADIIIAENNYEIETHYIYGSRKAWRIASQESDELEIKTLLDWSHPNHLLSIKDLAEVFHMKEEELCCFLPDEYEKLKELTPSTLQAIKNHLSVNKDFKEYLSKNGIEKKKNLKRYLMENIDFSEKNVAFVELAGSGYTQICLSKLISEFYNHPITTFYFKMDRVYKDTKVYI